MSQPIVGIPVRGRQIAPKPAPRIDGDAVAFRVGKLAQGLTRGILRLAVFCLLAMLVIGVVPVAMVSGGIGGVLWLAGVARLAAGLSRRRRQRRRW